MAKETFQMICGKVIFNTRQDAQNAVNGMHHDKRHTKSKIKANAAYFCNDCNAYHITSGEQKRPKIKGQFKDFTQDLNSAITKKRKSDQKSGTKNLIVHTRLNFKVK